jgi:putative nucleotidyltransferase with HDIG domain
VERDQSDGSTRYLTFQVLPLNEYKPATGLLLLVEDVTRFGQIGQSLIQSRNELVLTRNALARAYEDLKHLALADKKSSQDALQFAYLELREAYNRTIEGWVRALDLRDRETESHTLRVTDITVKLARAMGIAEAQIEHIRRGALLHDIGKMGIPDSILFKREKLTDEEWAIMQRHSAYAYEMLYPIAYLHPAMDIPFSHHEKWDGSGYPRGLKGEEIPLAARLFAIVDVWDALRSDRPYRQGLPEEKVREYLREEAGKHFDPEVVKVFLSMIDEILEEQSVVSGGFDLAT